MKSKENVEKFLANFSLLNEIMYSAENIDTETGDYNLISHNNHISIISDIILSNKELNREEIVKKASEYDLEHLHTESFHFDKKWIFDNTINHEMLHHRQILFEKTFIDNLEIRKILKFNPNFLNVLIFEFTNNKFVLESDSFNKYTKDVRKQVDALLHLLSIPIDELCQLEKKKIIYAIQDNPIINLNGKYVLSSVYTLKSNIRRILNYKLKNNQSYKKHKGDVLEDLIFDISKYYFEGNIYRNLEYSGGENDIVLESENDLFVIECKAIDVYDDFMRNIDSKYIENNLEDIIIKPKKQGENLFDAIDKEKTIKSNGEKVTFNKRKKRHIISISWSHPYDYVVDSKYDFLNLSYSDYITILNLTGKGCFIKENYKCPFEIIKEMFKTKINSDPLKNFLLLLTTNEEYLKLFKKNKNFVADVKLGFVRHHDSLMIGILNDFEKREENKTKLSKLKDFNELLIRDDDFRIRMDFSTD